MNLRRFKLSVRITDLDVPDRAVDLVWVVLRWNQRADEAAGLGAPLELFTDALRTLAEGALRPPDSAVSAALRFIRGED